jgi:hypothetical protein
VAGAWDAMKFTWFNLMPWPHLPEDFREKHHSVWVGFPVGSSMDTNYCDGTIPAEPRALLQAIG